MILGVLSLAGAAYTLYTLYRLGERTLGLLQSGPLSYLTSQVTVLVTYLRLVLWPAGLSVDHDFTAVSFRSSYFWFCALLLIAVLAAAVKLRNSSPSTSFLVLAFFIFLAPTSSFVPSADLMFEHRLYLPMITGSIVLALTLLAIVGRILKTSRWREAAFVTCALLLLAGIRHSIANNGLSSGATMSGSGRTRLRKHRERPGFITTLAYPISQSIEAGPAANFSGPSNCVPITRLRCTTWGGWNRPKAAFNRPGNTIARL